MSYTALPPYTDDEDAGEGSSQVPAFRDSKLDDKTTTTIDDDSQTSRITLPPHLDYERDSDQNIICTDPILTDPSYFSAFLQHHGAKPPDLRLQIEGSHWEDNSEGPDRTDGNTVKSKSSTLVVDFDFSIPLTSEVLIRRNRNTPPYFFTYRPEVPTYRNSTLKRRQTDLEESRRIDAGLSVGQQAIVEYLQSTHQLKEFRFEKVACGWDMESLKRQVTTIVRRTGYTGMINVSLTQREQYIYIRPAKTFSKIYRHRFTLFLRFLLFPLGLLFLLLDYVWLGAYWQVLGAKYDLYASGDDDSPARGISVDQFLITFGDRIAESARRGLRQGRLDWP